MRAELHREGRKERARRALPPPPPSSSSPPSRRGPEDWLDGRTGGWVGRSVIHARARLTSNGRLIGQTWMPTKTNEAATKKEARPASLVAQSSSSSEDRWAFPFHGSAGTLPSNELRGRGRRRRRRRQLHQGSREGRKEEERGAGEGLHPSIHPPIRLS